MMTSPRRWAFLFTSACLLSSAHAELQDPKKDDEDYLKYNKEVIAKLQAKDFAWLDHEAEELRNKRVRTQTGGWKLRQFAQTLSSPWDQAEMGHWQDRMDLLKAWHESSKTAFATEMDGAGHQTAAAISRGGGFAKDVTQDGWEGFKKELAQTESLLEESLKMDPKNPDICQHLLDLGIKRGWDKAKMMETLKQGIAAAPDYSANFEMMAYWELPRWHGQQGDWARFLNSIPDMVPGEDGYAMFTNTVTFTLMYIPPQEVFGADDRADRISWKKMKRGFEALKARGPESATMVNREAFFAMANQDKELLAKDLKILDEKNMIIPHEWQKPGNLEMARKLVKGE